MTRIDPHRAAIHRSVYMQFLDELDKDIAQKIMEQPDCEESLLLNRRVDAEIRRRLDALAMVEAS